jgi:hypothetical protein
MASISDEETKTAAATGVEDEQQKTEEETSEGEDEAKKRLAAAAPDLKEPKKDKTEDAAPVEESSKNKPKRMCRFPGCNKVIKRYERILSSVWTRSLVRIIYTHIFFVFNPMDPQKPRSLSTPWCHCQTLSRGGL